MNRLITFLSLLLVTCLSNLLSQTITFTDIDVSTFPIVSTSFMALNQYGSSYTDISTKDFNVFENGVKVPSNLLEVICKTSPMKVVLVLDKSTSMQDIEPGESERKWDWVVEGATAFINEMQYANGSQVAITTFGGESYFKCDFTDDRKKLYDSIMTIEPYGKTNFNKAFFGPKVGAVELLKDQPTNFRRIIVFLTDGKHDDSENGPMLPDSILNTLVENNIQLYAITLLSETNLDLNSIAVSSGGNYSSVNTKKQLNKIYVEIAEAIKDKILCKLSWPTSMVCDDIERWKTAEIEYVRHSKRFTKLYQVPEIGVATITTDEKIYKFGNPDIGSYADFKIKLNSENSDVSITNINITPSTYFTVLDYGFGPGINPTYPINIKQNTDYFITVRFTPSNLKTFRKANMVITGTPCPLIVPMIGGIPEINVDTPKEGNFFSKCDTVDINWSGVDGFTATDLFYSLNDGLTWTQIAKAVKGNLYRWRPGFEFKKIHIKAEVSPTQTYVWAMSGGGKQGDNGTGIAISNDQLSVYVCGYLSSPAVFSAKYVPNLGNTDAFLAKYDIDGNLDWVQTDGGIGNDSAFSVVTDVQNYVYYTGACYAPAQFGSITPVMPIYAMPYVFIAKYDEGGKVINANCFGANNSYLTFRAWGRYVRTSGNNIQVIAEYTGEMKVGTINLPQTNTPRTFTLTYDRNLNLLGATVGGTIQKVTKVTDKDNFQYSFTNFTGYTDFDRYTVKSEGNYDVAVTKYGQSSEGFDISDDFTLYSPILEPTLPRLDLGVCLVGDSCIYSYKSLITNTSKVPAKITKINVTSPIDPNFIKIDSTLIGLTINPGDSIDFNFALQSYVRGTYTANVILTGDCDELVNIPINCAIECKTKTSDTIDFGVVFLNTPKTLKIDCLIENFNGIDLPINPLVQGKNANEYTLNKLQQDTVFAKKCYEVEIIFNPRQLGERTARINLSMKDPCGEQFIYLKGMGSNPSAILPQEIDWKVRRTNKNYDSTVTIYNPTYTDMYLQDITFKNAPPNGEFINNNSAQFPIKLPSMQTINLPVSFFPTDEIYYENELTYKIQNKDSIDFMKVKLKGTGFFPKMEYTWSCGQAIKPGDTSVAVLNIKNTSNNSELSIDRIRFSIKNGIYDWVLGAEPANEKIASQTNKDYLVYFMPKDLNPNPNSFIITADDYDGTFNDFWKETRANITCKAMGIKYPDTHDFGNQVICSNNIFKIALENLSNDTDIDIDFPNASFTGTKSNAFSINQNSKIIIKPNSKFEFEVVFTPVSTGLHSAQLLLPNNFGIPISIDFSGYGKVFTVSSDKTKYEQLPGKKQEISIKFNANNISNQISNLDLKLIYNKKQIKFDTTFFENLITSNWTWKKPIYNSNGTIELANENGTLPGTYNGDIAKFRIMFLLDSGEVSDLICETKYSCKSLPDTIATLITTPVCFDSERKIYVKVDNKSAIYELPSPNPATDNLILKFSCGVPFDLNVSIYNTMGMKVADLIHKSYTSGIFQEKLDIKNIESGVYILEYYDGITKYHEKITITK